MAFSPFASLDGTVRWDALLEQGTVIRLVYENLRAQVEQVISGCGGGQLLGWSFQPDGWPPSYCVFRQGNNIYVAIAGTTNSQQVVGHLMGAFAVPYLTEDVRVHTFFQIASEVIRVQIQDSMPPDVGSCLVHWTGHSYGSALAFLCACAHARQYGSHKSHFMGFGGPKPFTEGTVNVLPEVNFLIANAGDGIAHLPPNRLISAVHLTLPVFQYSLPANWTHHSTCYNLTQAGILGRTVPSAFNGFVSPLLVAQTLTSHGMGYYMRNVVTGWQLQGGTGQDTFLVALNEQYNSLPDTENLANNIDIRNYVDLPAMNTTNFPGPGPGPLTNANLLTQNNLTGSITNVSRVDSIFSGLNEGERMSIKFTWFFHDRLGGITETYYADGAGGPAGVNIQQQAAYLTRRMGISGSNMTFDYLRISTVGTAREVRVFVPADFPTGTPFSGTWTQPNDTGADFASVALLTRKYSGLKYSRLFLRGVPDVVMVNGGQYVPGAQYANAFTLFKNAVIALGYQWGAATTPAANSPAGILAAVQNADGTIGYTLSTTLFQGLANLSHVVVRISGQTSPRGINGVRTVVVTGASTCTTLRPELLGTFVAGAGRMFRNTRTYPPITDMQVERVTTRKAGRPFGVLVGRSRALRRA